MVYDIKMSLEHFSLTYDRKVPVNNMNKPIM